MAGKPAHEIDWSKLDGMLVFDASVNVCADILGVSHDTLERHVKREKGMTFGEYKAIKVQQTVLRLKQTMIKKALGGDNTCMIFALKNMSTWSDKVEHSFDKDKKTILLKYSLNEAETVVGGVLDEPKKD